MPKPDELIRNILSDMKVELTEMFDRNFERKRFFRLQMEAPEEQKGERVAPACNGKNAPFDPGVRSWERGALFLPAAVHRTPQRGRKVRTERPYPYPDKQAHGQDLYRAVAHPADNDAETPVYRRPQGGAAGDQTDRPREYNRVFR